MSGQSEVTSASEEKRGRVLTAAAQSAGYNTLIVGYLLTILTTSHLTPGVFLLFTFLQVGYCALLWWLMWKQLQGWQFVVSIGVLILITECVGLLPLLGIDWDWLLFLVMLAYFFMLLSLRAAIMLGIFLYLSMVINLGLLNNWYWSNTYASLLSFLPAFLLVSTFSLVVRFLELQRIRAEELVSQLEESHTELERAHKQLQEYTQEVEELTIVRERTRVAREIHDTLGHYLSILNIQLETISKFQEHDVARAADEIAEARRVAAQSMQEVRNAVAALRPTSIATLGLTETLMQLGKEFEYTMPHVALILDLETELPALSPDISIALYRVAQEAFTNIRKHSQASKVLVRLRYEDEIVELFMLDNGCGTSQNGSEKPEGFGLIGLRERVELLNGQVSYGPTDQEGYRIVVSVPVTTVPRTFSQKDHGYARPHSRLDCR